jgi:hypothetical protein
VLRDLVSENVEMIRHALGVLRFLEVLRGPRAKLEARGQPLEAQHVFEREDRSSLGRRSHLKKKA